MRLLGDDTCPTCGVDHEGACPFGTTDVCPVCGEVVCICDFFEDPLEGIEFPEEDYTYPEPLL